ncbi:MAG: hypothetical protein ABI472_05445 [Ginsengibacter sp.]
MKHKYHILEWKAADILKFLQFTQINFAVFNFDKPTLGHYSLSVAGFDAKGDFLGTSPIEKYKGPTEPDLENAYNLGLFFVLAANVNTYSGGGTKALYFEPVSYTPTGGTQEYVSYNIHDAPPKHGIFDEKTVVTKINPSPPRNGGV